MKSDKLQDAVGLVRDDFIEDAEYTAERKAKVYPWVKWVAAAACVLIAVLIAVPAIEGSSPDVVSKSSEPTPVEGPTGDPVNEPDTEPGVEPDDEPTTSYTAQPSWAAGGIWIETRDYASYEEFAADVYDPVFEAFAESDEGKKHGYTYQVNSTPNTSVGEDGELHEDRTLIRISCSWSNSAEVVLANDVESATVYSYNYEPILAQSFAVADEEGTSKNYQVEGIEVQKIGGDDTQRITMDGVWRFFEGGGDFSSQTIERVNINGLWYYVEGTNEAEVDAIAEALAHIAATL